MNVNAVVETLLHMSSSQLRISFNLQCRWLTNLIGLAITAVMGEWLCLQREMRDIPVGACTVPLAVTEHDCACSSVQNDKLSHLFKAPACQSMRLMECCCQAAGSGSRRRGSGTEMVSLRSSGLPSPSVTPKAVTASSFQALKLPGSVSGTRSSSGAASLLPV